MNRVFTFAFAIVLQSFSAQNDPFPIGFSMGDMGTIIWENSITARQPWTPAIYMNDSLRFGVACAIVSFYDNMDNFQNEGIYRISCGGWYSAKKLKIKCAFSQMSALSMYYERSGSLSIGTGLLRHLRMSAEFTGISTVLVNDRVYSHTEGSVGFSVWIPFRLVAVATSVKQIMVKKSLPDQTQSILIATGLHTSYNRFGAQGVIFEITPKQALKYRIIFGEEIRLFDWLKVHVSLSTRPFLLGFGVNVQWRAAAADLSLVNHPVLGWSQGFSAGYGWDLKK